MMAVLSRTSRTGVIIQRKGNFRLGCKACAPQDNIPGEL